MSKAPAIANHVASRAGNAEPSCGTSANAPPSERRKSTEAAFASRNATRLSIASSPSSRSSVLPPTKPGMGASGSAAGISSRISG